MISKKEASYVELAPRRHCEDCSMFHRGEFVNGCKLVTGPIKAKASCRYWEPKKK